MTNSSIIQELLIRTHSWYYATMPYALCIYFHHYMSDSFYKHLDISSILTICSLWHFHFSEDLTTPMSRVTLTFCHLQDFVSSNILTTYPPQYFVISNSAIWSTMMPCHVWLPSHPSLLTPSTPVNSTYYHIWIMCLFRPPNSSNAWINPAPE